MELQGNLFKIPVFKTLVWAVTGPVCISVLIPKTRGELEISVESSSENVSSFKEKIGREIEVPANKQMLSGKVGYLEDSLSLAYYNVAGGEKLFLWLC